MEILAAVLTSLLGLAGAPGIVIDRTVADLLRGQIARADQLEVRVDNVPNYRILQGKVDRVRLAGRGVYIVPFLRIDTVDLETDPISIDPDSIRTGKIKLLQPLQAAVRVVVKSDDLNEALKSPAMANSFKGIKADLSAIGAGGAEEFDLLNPEVTFLDGNRIRLEAALQPRLKRQQDLPKPIAVSLETGLTLFQGTRLRLDEPEVNFQGVKVPRQVTRAFALGLNRLLDLRQLEVAGITARVLKFEVSKGQIQVIGFARLESIK